MGGSADPRILDPVDWTGTRLPRADDLPGMQVHDADGGRLGTVGGAWTDPTGTLLQCVSVTSGWINQVHHLVPADDLRLANDGAGDFLVLQGGEPALRAAPTADPDADVAHDHDGAELRRWAA